MRKCLFIFFILFLMPTFCFAKSGEKYDVKEGGFLDFGRYVETFEINDEVEEEQDVLKEDDSEEFEQAAIKEIADRFNSNTVNLNLNTTDDSLSDVNYDRVFKLKVNETQYNIEQNIKSETMIWDSSKAFTQAFQQTSTRLSPIPTIINESYVTAQVSPSLSATIGQRYFYNYTKAELMFIRAKETTYNTGSIISYRDNGLNIAVSSYMSTHTHNHSGGFILSSDSIKLPHEAGSFVVGAASYMTGNKKDNDSTTGIFGAYTYKRLTLNAQVAENKYTGATDYGTSVYFVPQLRLTDSIFVKTRIIRNISQNTNQDELVLTFKPKNSKNNFEFEINASNHYNQNFRVKQRIKLSTSFKI